jgi:hypothetical protein
MNSLSPYRDFWLRLGVSITLTFFFVFLGTDSLSDIVNGKYFISDTLSCFTLIFIVTTYISIITTYLDRQYPWHAYIATRVLYQLIAGFVIPAMLVLAYMYTYLIVILGFKKEEITFFYTEFPISILFIIFWNAVYVGYFFYRESSKQKVELQTLKAQLYTLLDIQTGSEIIPALAGQQISDNGDDEPEFNQAEPHDKIRILVAVSGNKNIPIPVENIAYFYKEGNYTNLTTFQSETYLLNHSLDELMRLLEESHFFRANRQFIINIKSCHFFTNEENGKLAIHLIPQIEDDVIISQKRSPAFRAWLNK